MVLSCGLSLVQIQRGLMRRPPRQVFPVEDYRAGRENPLVTEVP